MNKANRFRFRAISIGDGKMVYGTGITDFLNVYPDDHESVWMWSCYSWIKIDPKTLRQSTGLTDNNGVEIFEGDIIDHEVTRSPKSMWESAVVEFRKGMFVKRNCSAKFVSTPLGHIHPCCIKVIGNIHQNPELLEAK